MLVRLSVPVIKIDNFWHKFYETPYIVALLKFIRTLWFWFKQNSSIPQRHPEADCEPLCFKVRLILSVHD
jgi:hypothetical protein